MIIDLQVNGAGDVLFNDAPTYTTLKHMANTLNIHGIAGFLPTLITDSPEKRTQAIEAVMEAHSNDLKSILGLHFEGPWVNLQKPGVHAANYITTIHDKDVETLLKAKQHIPHIMVTLAPECVPNDILKTLIDAGIIISIGHSLASLERCLEVYELGVRAITHLFNAMPPLSARAPGIIGFFLETADVWAGLIADHKHVHPTLIDFVLKLKPDYIYLTSDGMPPMGGSKDHFLLYQQHNYGTNNPTLAGGMITNLEQAHLLIKQGHKKEDILPLISTNPARFLQDNQLN